MSATPQVTGFLGDRWKPYIGGAVISYAVAGAARFTKVNGGAHRPMESTAAAINGRHLTHAYQAAGIRGCFLATYMANDFVEAVVNPVTHGAVAA
ncbi:MAG: hypothetical protein MK106_01165 [Mariniblastus sp.]|nr:hypothetical protein [Mariniblastus sp.]